MPNVYFSCFTLIEEEEEQTLLVTITNRLHLNWTGFYDQSKKSSNENLFGQNQN
jgi:hypothetical protein